MSCAIPDDLESNASTELSFQTTVQRCNSDSSNLALDQSLETLLIFDWDDTLFPTTRLEQLGCKSGQLCDLPADDQAHFKELSGYVERTLCLAKGLGRVAIVTNAAAGWVEHSCNNFFPNLTPLLEELDIISARSSYERYAPGCPVAWKRLAFEDLVAAAFEEFDKDQMRNILSIGDAMFEHDALTAVTQNMPHCLSKTLKLSESPTLMHLIEEQRVLGSCLEEVVSQDVSLDLEIGDAV